MNPRFVGCLIGLLLSGCATYQTPGAGVSMGDLSKAMGWSPPPSNGISVPKWKCEQPLKRGWERPL